MKLTASQLKQIIKEELDSMHDSSEEKAPAGRPHKIKKGSHGFVLIHRNPTDPMSSAVNAPPGVAKAYNHLKPGQWVWVDDDYLNSVEPDPVTYSHGMYENSEATEAPSVLPIDGLKSAIEAKVTDEQALVTVLGLVADAAQRIGARLDGPDKTAINNVEKGLLALMYDLMNI